MFVTFYDVAKAYDKANIEDMLVIAWEHGIRGKLWRLMKSLNTNLTARIKLRHGMTREIERKAGGKQRGKKFWLPLWENDGCPGRRGRGG